MSILDSALSLDEMEHALGSIILENKGRIRTIGDIGLTNEDYKLLELHFRGFRNFLGDISMYERYGLCLLTYGTYLLKNESDNQKVIEIMQSLALQVPQYMHRRVYEVFDNTIKDYALSNPSIHLTNISQLIQIFLMYSYDDEAVYDVYFSEIEKCGQESYTDEFFEKLNQKVFVREQELYDEPTKKMVFTMCRDAYFDCRNNGLTEDEMLNKYARISYLFVKSCCKWCAVHEKEMRMKIVR